MTKDYTHVLVISDAKGIVSTQKIHEEKDYFQFQAARNKAVKSYCAQLLTKESYVKSFY